MSDAPQGRSDATEGDELSTTQSTSPPGSDLKGADAGAFLELMGAPRALFDARGRVLDVNARLLELAGRSRDDVIGGDAPHLWWSMRGWGTNEVVEGESDVAVFDGAGGEIAMRCLLAAIPSWPESAARWVAILGPWTPSSSSGRHAGRVADLVERMGGSLGWGCPHIARLRQATLLHDAGAIGVLGADALAEVIDPEQAAWVRHHGERWDGAGSPDGLAGNDIPEGAALIAVADAFDVMVTGRPQAAPRTPADSLEEIRSLAGTRFAPRAVGALAAVLAAAPATC